MSDDSTRPIVIKRKKVVAGGAHGGAWKIAYADFVTAMMAFFLLMWLLGSTAKGDLQGIAEFFQNPLMIANKGGSGSGDASSVLQGGGKDLTRQAGQVKQGDIESQKKTYFAKETNAEFKRKERESLENLKSQIEKMIQDSPQLSQFKRQMLLDITSEGLRIQIVDEQNRPMFDSGGAELKPYTRDILRQIGLALNSVTNRISLAGHTDAAKFADQNDPLNAVNRRISIVVLNKKTEMAILQEEGPESEVDDAVGLPDGLKLPGVAKGPPE